MKNCIFCKYCSLTEETDYIGECKYLPPRSYHDGIKLKRYYPPVSYNDWCSKFVEDDVNKKIDEFSVIFDNKKNYKKAIEVYEFISTLTPNFNTKQRVKDLVDEFESSDFKGAFQSSRVGKTVEV